MKTIFVGTGRKPFVLELEDELQNLQALVGGRIEVLHFHTEGTRTIDLIFNEEYRFLYDEVNRWIVYPGGEKDYIAGNIIISAADEETGEFVDLSDEEIKLYLKEFEKDTLTFS